MVSGLGTITATPGHTKTIPCLKQEEAGARGARSLAPNLQSEHSKAKHQLTSKCHKAVAPTITLSTGDVRCLQGQDSILGTLGGVKAGPVKEGGSAPALRRGASIRHRQHAVLDQLVKPHPVWRSGRRLLHARLNLHLVVHASHQPALQLAILRLHLVVHA